MHLICSLWHHEITFQDVDSLQEIEDVDLLIRQKFGREKPVSAVLCRSARPHEAHNEVRITSDAPFAKMKRKVLA